MNYKRIEENDFSHMGLNKLDFVMNNMTEEEKENYIQLYNLYRSLFTKFMIEKLDLEQYDNMILDSNLEFKKVNIEDMDVFQYFSSDELSYIYIRNNLHIEKLDESELLFLKEKLGYNNLELDEKTTEFIDNTFYKVIFEDTLGNGEKCLIPFGPYRRDMLSENDSIVIGIRYDRFYDDGLEDKKWVERDDKQRAFLYSLMDRMNTELKDRLKASIRIIEYDEHSVIPMNKKD